MPATAAAPARSARRHITALPGGRCRVRVARTAAEVEALRDAWTSTSRDDVRTDLDYFLWSLRNEPQVIRPHVLCVERGGHTEAIVAARLMDVPVRSKLGYWTVCAPTVRAISVLHNGVLGGASSEIAEAIVDALLRAVERGEADAAVFRQLRLDSTLRRAVAARGTAATRERLLRSDRRWEVVLPSRPEAYVESLSSSTRKGMRRTARHLERDFGKRLSVAAFRDPGELDVYFEDVETVAARTHQRRRGVGYLGDRRQRARLELLARRGWFRGYILYLDGRPIAFELGELYGGRFRSLAGAYDWSYRDHRVGAYLLVRAIEHLTAEPDVSVFDFGFGDAPYKSKFAHRSRDEADLMLYARRARPLLVNLASETLFGISRAATSTLGRLGLLDRIEQSWRRRADAPA